MIDIIIFTVIETEKIMIGRSSFLSTCTLIEIQWILQLKLRQTTEACHCEKGPETYNILDDISFHSGGQRSDIDPDQAFDFR